MPSHACGHGELAQLPGISGISALCTPGGGWSTLTPYSWSFVPRVSFSGQLERVSILPVTVRLPIYLMSWHCFT